MKLKKLKLIIAILIVLFVAFITTSVLFGGKVRALFAIYTVLDLCGIVITYGIYNSKKCEEENEES